MIARLIVVVVIMIVEGCWSVHSQPHQDEMYYASGFNKKQIKEPLKDTINGFYINEEAAFVEWSHVFDGNKTDVIDWLLHRSGFDSRPNSDTTIITGRTNKKPLDFKKAGSKQVNIDPAIVFFSVQLKSDRYKVIVSDIAWYSNLDVGATIIMGTPVANNHESTSLSFHVFKGKSPNVRVKRSFVSEDYGLSSVSFSKSLNTVLTYMFSLPDLPNTLTDEDW